MTHRRAFQDENQNGANVPGRTQSLRASHVPSRKGFRCRFNKYRTFCAVDFILIMKGVFMILRHIVLPLFKLGNNRFVMGILTFISDFGVLIPLLILYPFMNCCCCDVLREWIVVS